MGFINKIKNFFYDEEEVEEEIVPRKVEHLKKKKEIIKDLDDGVSERELFRSERTFNFPMDIDDEEDFTPVTRRIKEDDSVKTNTRVEPKEHKVGQAEETRKPYSYVKPIKKEEKKFRPTPVISPVFGILDEDYKADLTSNNLEETKEFNMTRKVTFDEIHKKAYGTPKVIVPTIEEEDNSEEVKGLFFNLNDEKNDAEDNSNDDDIKITYNNVDYDSPDDDDEIEVPKISRSKKNNTEKDKEESDDDILSETREQDLFNLIDNMYNSDEEEEVE